MRIFRNIFRKRQQPETKPLVIEGIAGAPITAEPDEAELAAQALLEDISGVLSSRTGNDAERHEPDKGTCEYYRELAVRIRQAHDAATLRTMRFIAFCEQALQNPDLPVSGPGSLELLEAELYKRIDTIERDGGELKRRWQRCLAEITVRQMDLLHGRADDKQKGKDTN